MANFGSHSNKDSRGDEAEDRRKRRRGIPESLPLIRRRVADIHGYSRQIDDLLGMVGQIQDFLEGSDVWELLPYRARRRLKRATDWLDKAKKKDKPVAHACGRLEEGLDYADAYLSRPESLLDKALEYADKVVYSNPVVKLVIPVAAIIGTVLWVCV